MQKSKRFLFTTSCPETVHDFSSYLVSNDILQYAQWQVEHSNHLFIHGYLETKEYTTISMMQSLIPGAFVVFAGDRQRCFKMFLQRERLGPWFTGRMLWQPAEVEESVLLQILGTHVRYEEYALFINYF